MKTLPTTTPLDARLSRAEETLESLKKQVDQLMGLAEEIVRRLAEEDDDSR